MQYDDWSLQRLREDVEKRSITYSAKDGKKTLSARLRQKDKMSTGVPEEQAVDGGETQENYHEVFLEKKALHKMKMEKLELQRQIGGERLEILALERLLQLKVRERLWLL